MSYGNYPDFSRVKKVLVVKLRHQGDLLLTSPVFSLLKKNLAHAKIDAFIYSETLPMLEGHPAIDQFFLYDRGIKKSSFFVRIWKELKLLLEIRKQKYDLVLNLTEGDRGALIALFSQSRYKVGFDPKGSGFRGKKKIYSHLVKSPEGERHTVERQIDALRRIGIFPDQQERDLTFHVPQSALDKMRKLLGENGITGSFFLIHPVSRWLFKCPPPAFTASLIDELKKKNIPIVLSSGPDAKEREFVQEILKKTSAQVLDLGGKISLKELGALIQLSRSLITVDSVPLHMASALKTPLVALFGPSSEKNWGPWMHPKACVVAQPFSCRPCHLDGCGGSKRSECLYTLSPSAVISALSSLGSI